MGFREAFVAILLPAAAVAMAQTPAKRSPSPPPPVTAATQQPTADNTALVAALRSDLEVVKQRIASSEAEDQKYTGGLIKAQIQSRIATLKLAEALLLHKLAAVQTGARQTLEAQATRADPAVSTSLDAEAETYRLKIEQARTDSARYNSGLIKAQKESTIATMESTLALMEQRALTAKYGLMLAPPGVASGSGLSTSQTSSAQVQATAAAAAPAKARAADEVITAKLLSKRFANQKYQDFVLLDIEFTAAKLAKPARAIKGTLNVNDLFGARQLGIGWTIDRPVGPGETISETGSGFKYNQFMERHNWAKNTEASNMTLSFTVESVLYQDGTREDF